MNGIRFRFPDATLPVIITWYKNSNLSQEVGRSATFAPSATGYTFTPPNLEPVGYTFFFWETPDGGTTLQTFITKWAIDGSALLRTAFVMYEYVVGRGQSETEGTGGAAVTVWSDPIVNDVLLTDRRIIGETIVVQMRGIGPLRSDEWAFTGEGIRLITPNQTFQDGDSIFILVSKSTAAPAAGGTSELCRLITDDEALSSDYFGKHNIAAFDNSTDPIHVTTFPAFATIPDDTQMEFSTFANEGLVYWILQFDGSDTVQFMGQARSRIVLRINERIKLWFKSDGTDIICYVTKYEGRLHLVGEVFMADRPDIPGAILADGSEYNIDDFTGLMEELNYGLPNRLVASTPTLTKFNETVTKRIGQQYDLNGTIPLVGTGTAVTYYPNRGKFIIDGSSEQKIRVPDARNQFFRVLKSYGSSDTDSERMTQGAGGRQAQEIIKHVHAVRHGQGGGIDTNPSGGAWISANANPINDPYVMASGGTEQRVDNDGKYALIYI